MGWGCWRAPVSAGLLCLPQQASKPPCPFPSLSPPQASYPHRLLRISYQPKSLSVREVTGGFEGLSTDRSAPTHSEACRGRSTGPWRGGSPFLFHPSPRSEEGISRRRLHPRHYGHPGCVCVCVCVLNVLWFTSGSRVLLSLVPCGRIRAHCTRTWRAMGPLRTVGRRPLSYSCIHWV